MRKIWADYAKAIGIILVVYGHVARGLMDSGIIINKNIFKLIDSIIYSFHIPLFFFISGIFFPLSLKKYGKKNLIIRKIETIAYPYLLWSIIQGTIMVLMSPYTNSKTTFSDVLSILWEPRDQFWFLYALFMIFIVATIIYKNFSKSTIVTIFIFSSFLYIFQSYIPEKYNFFHFDYITNNFVFFAGGIIFFDIFNEKKFSSGYLVLIFLILFILSQYLFHITFNKTFEDKGLFSLTIALISILFVIELSIFLDKIYYSELLEIIGKSSLAIYILHVLVTGGTRIILKNIFNIYSPFLHLILGVVLGIFVPVLIFKIVNKYNIPYIFSLKISRH